MHGNRSVNYRTVKLFFIGKEGRGKTTLRHRLRSVPMKEVKKTTTSTVGVDIDEWYYPETKRTNKSNVHFLTWDFAGQVRLLCVRVSMAITITVVLNYTTPILGCLPHNSSMLLFKEISLSCFVPAHRWLSRS